MGDRGNIKIYENDPECAVWFYAHWSGTELFGVLKAALARRQRWDDHQYLARIIFDEMTKGQQGEETGFGISTHIGDNDMGRPILAVGVDAQEVSLKTENGRVLETFTFSEFIKLEKDPRKKFDGR